MTNNEFDADTEHLDDEFEQGDAAGADESPNAPPVAKKSGGGFGKIILVLIILGGGGVLGAAKMGFVKLPVAIPGITPPSAVKQAEHQAPKKEAPKAVASTHAPAPSAQSEQKPNHDENASLGVIDNGPNLSVSPSIALPAPVVAEKKALPELAAPPLKQAPAAPPAQMFPGLVPPPPSSNTVAPPDNTESKNSASILMPQAIGNETGDGDASAQKIVSPMAQAEATKLAVVPPVADPVVQQPVTASVDTKAFESRLSALEEKVNSLSENQVKKSDIADLQASFERLQKEISGRGHETARTVAEKPSARHHVSHRADEKPTVSSTRWILKSAKPGTAWVAAEGTGDLRTVSVGDTLPGIGKITSVATGADGHWVVTGSHGKINQ